MHNIFDSTFNGMARSELYRSYFVPDLFPHEKPARIQNWPEEDREAYCGIYTLEKQWELQGW